MAASDQHYRNQKTLDVVFAISCVVMLLTIMWMFAQDYFKEFKAEQRVFRDVETAVAERELADQFLLMVARDVDDAEKEKAPEYSEYKDAVKAGDAKGYEIFLTRFAALSAKVKEAKQKVE